METSHLIALKQLYLLTKSRGDGNYTINELMTILGITSKRNLGNLMKKLGYISHPQRSGTKVQKMYAIVKDLIYPVSRIVRIPLRPIKTNLAMKIVLKQFYKLTNLNGDKPYATDELIKASTMEFKSKRDFGHFMKKIGYESHIQNGRRVYMLINSLIYPVTRINRMPAPKEIAKIYVVENNTLYELPDYFWQPEKKVSLMKNVTL